MHKIYAINETTITTLRGINIFYLFGKIYRVFIGNINEQNQMNYMPNNIDNTDNFDNLDLNNEIDIGIYLIFHLIYQNHQYWMD